MAKIMVNIHIIVFLSLILVERKTEMLHSKASSPHLHCLKCTHLQVSRVNVVNPVHTHLKGARSSLFAKTQLSQILSVL